MLDYNKSHSSYIRSSMQYAIFAVNILIIVGRAFGSKAIFNKINYNTPKTYNKLEI